MPSQKNLDQVKTLQDKLSRAKSVVLADYRGLTVAQQSKLRRQILEVEGELVVAKNSLLKLALEAEKYSLPEDFAQTLEGPTMTLFAYSDPIAPIKTLAQFVKENELATIKLGFLVKEPLAKVQVEELATLPSKVELIGKTVATIKSPLTGIVNVLSANFRNLVYVLKAVKS